MDKFYKFALVKNMRSTVRPEQYPYRSERAFREELFRWFAAAALIIACSGVCFAQPVRFLTTQFAPVAEARTFRDSILSDFPDAVRLDAVDASSVYVAQAHRLASERSGGVVFGGLYQDFLRLKRASILGSVEGLGPTLTAAGAGSRELRLAKLGTGRPYFIPWMKATYLMAANRRALRYLPRGASLYHLTYNELLEWAKNMYAATGEPKLGFPAGPNGLFDRFLEGYLYPSFTGSVSGGFDGRDAPLLWDYLRSLWEYVSPSSFVFNRMSEPLLDGQVWVAWDHTARLLRAFEAQPHEFVAFPAPAGPAGLGYISVVAGLGFPPGRPSPKTIRFVSYLTSPRVEGITLRTLGFMPARSSDQIPNISPGLEDLLLAARRQERSDSALQVTMPALPTGKAAAFDLAYLESFSRIVLRDVPAREVLPRAMKRIRALLAADATAAMPHAPLPLPSATPRYGGTP